MLIKAIRDNWAAPTAYVSGQRKGTESKTKLERESADPGGPHKPLQTYLVEVGFDALPDRAEQMQYADIPTSLQLPEDTVDRLLEVAGRILYDSEQFQKLVRDLGGKIPFSPEKHGHTGQVITNSSAEIN